MCKLISCFFAKDLALASMKHRYNVIKSRIIEVIQQTLTWTSHKQITNNKSQNTNLKKISINKWQNRYMILKNQLSCNRKLLLANNWITNFYHNGAGLTIYCLWTIFFFTCYIMHNKYEINNTKRIALKCFICIFALKHMKIEWKIEVWNFQNEYITALFFWCSFIMPGPVTKL